MRIAVIGDLMLDVSAEVVPRDNAEGALACYTGATWRYHPGGAALVASEIERQDVAVDLYGCIGDDWAGMELLRVLHGFLGTRTRHVRVGMAVTTLKARAYCGGQIVTRLDREQPGLTMPAPLPDAPGDYAAIVLVGYCKGMFTGDGERTRALIERAREARVPVIINPHPACDRGLWHGATLATMNAAEWTALGDIGAEWTAATRGAEGVTLYRGAQWAGEYETERVDDAQVVGAGDAFTAACAVKLAAGGAVPEAVWGAVRYATDYVRRQR
ncbi:MAG: bifunctional hydroxymethylpyrimidine kinase/phosphomethylpyrimidine kinase [Candidatus Thermoplasmatota archaeon]|nr:bifunctional hydroxymethylpyrimidine kinase/phosphomethylpyrimidine kinase [Candidatus Thermoplasmatota archaeon]